MKTRAEIDKNSDLCTKKVSDKIIMGKLGQYL